MRNKFAGLLEYTEEDFKELWAEALFVVDTNILINFYKYTSKDSTKSLFDILKKLNEMGRLWIPHQVALEYFFNYDSNMSKPKEGYKLLVDKLSALNEEAEKAFRNVESDYPYIVTEPFKFFIESLEQEKVKIQEELTKSLEKLPDAEAIKEDLLELLEGVVGEPYDQARINDIELDGKERYANEIPPGFKDAKAKDKQGYRIFGEMKYQQKFGDLIMWNQIIDRAKDEQKPTSIIFITEEKKEDWWEKDESGYQIKRPQPNLIKEFLDKTQKKFYMYRTDNFIKFAKINLEGLQVTDEQVENVTKEVENIRRSEEKNERENFTEKSNGSVKGVSDSYIPEDLSDLPPKIFAEYLSEENRSLFNKYIIEALSGQYDLEQIDYHYNRAIRWAVQFALPSLERKVSKLLEELVNKDYEKAREFKKLFPDFGVPTHDNLKRFRSLLRECDYLETELLLINLEF
ncbi:PIN-like domain-containing protein [Priestia megaterium]|uniref:PIN-like domain-containing protein n=1 Tax=Priestia megaterium TaxID=1404 RepID=UPI001FB48563|nr:PIN-like domain-containing protein [Priestia megaterium]